jgi:hypothetical protein
MCVCVCVCVCVDACRLAWVCVLACVHVCVRGGCGTNPTRLTCTISETNALTREKVPGVPPNAGISIELDVSTIKRTSAAVDTHVVHAAQLRSDVGVATVAMYSMGGRSQSVRAEHTRFDVGVGAVDSHSVGPHDVSVLHTRLDDAVQGDVWNSVVGSHVVQFAH